MELTQPIAQDFPRTLPGTALVRHDLRALGDGVVRRRVEYRPLDPAAPLRTDETVLELAHGCVSCTLREDVLPLLRTLAQRPDVQRIVLHLDPALEPESVCWCIESIALDEDGAQCAGDFVEIEAVISVLNGATWLHDATGSAE